MLKKQIGESVPKIALVNKHRNKENDPTKFYILVHLIDFITTKGGKLLDGPLSAHRVYS